MNRRMTTGVLLALSLSLVLGATLSLPTAKAGQMGTWVPNLSSVGLALPDSTIVSNSDLIKSVATLNVALSKFEGTLQAYSFSEDPRLEEQVLFASNNLGKSLESFNTELKEIYPDLTKEQQEAFKDVYLSLGSYLAKLAEEANQIFQDDDGKAKATFEVQEIGEIAPNLANQVWVGSVTSI